LSIDICHSEFCITRYCLPIFLLLTGAQIAKAQHISEFTSLTPGAQNTDFYLPGTHTFQYLIQFGDSLTEGGTLPDRNDFTAYVPIDGRSDSAYLFINAENPFGGATVLDISKVARGIYLVRILSEKGRVYSQKVIKE